jgi:hypothetical protein
MRRLWKISVSITHFSFSLIYADVIDQDEGTRNTFDIANHLEFFNDFDKVAGVRFPNNSDAHTLITGIVNNLQEESGKKIKFKYILFS